MSARILGTLLALLPFALTIPILPRADTSLGLHWAPNGTCNPDQMTAVTNAITDMRKLVTAAKGALKAQSGPPASYFFPSSGYSVATSVFNSVGWAILPADQMSQAKDDELSWLNAIHLYCQDLDNLCDTPAPGNTPGSSTARNAYVPTDSNPAPGLGTGKGGSSAAEIVVCPAMLSLPRTQAPCTGTPGLANLGWAFLRTFVTLRSVQTGGFSKLARDSITDAAPGVDQSHALKNNGWMGNADNYAQMATWANDLGVNADGVAQCPNAWPASWA